MANACQFLQVVARHVHYTQRHLPSRPPEESATSPRGPRQIPWATPWSATHLATTHLRQTETTRTHPRQDILADWPQVTALPQQQNPALQNHPETDLDLWNPTLGVRLPHPTSKSWNVSSRKPYVWSWTPHGMCRTLLSDAISACQRSRKKSATTAHTTASASVHTLTTSFYPSSSHLTTGDCDDSCPTICLPDSSVLVVIVN
jgi:hypothetical protein